MVSFLIQLSPLLVVLGAAIIILLIGSWWKRANSEMLLVIAVAGLALSVWFSWQGWLRGAAPLFMGAVPFGVMLKFDNLALIGFILFAISSGLAIIAAHNYITERNLPVPEFLSLILFAVFGAGIMASSINLIVIFIGLETLSLSAYVLAGFGVRPLHRCSRETAFRAGASMGGSDPRSNEASIKYFILGSVSSAILLLGIAFYYGATGTLEILNSQFSILNSSMLLLAAGLIIAGLGFKIAAVPFQWWTPDVYQGSPLPVTTFFATTVKAAAFIAFFRIIGALSGLQGTGFIQLFSILAVATMIFGNLAALFQEDIKRMLAYSSIAHAGYILLAFVFVKQDVASAQSAMFFYLLAYIVMTAGAFAILTFGVRPLHRHFRGDTDFPGISTGGSDPKGEKTTLADFAGIGRSNPWLALAFTIFLLSLAGFPPTAGFFAKFYLFKAALQRGHTTLVIIAVINSLISVYYYMRPVVAMYFSAPSLFPPPSRGREWVGGYDSTSYSTIGVIIFSLIAVLLLGIAPSSVLIILGR